MKAVVLARLTEALDATDDRIEQLWDLPYREACEEWTRLRDRRHRIEATIRRVEMETVDLRAELTEFANAAEAYMRHHAEKFYEGLPAPTGLWPQIEKARMAIAKATGTK